MDECEQEYEKCYYAETCSQSVDAVDEVYRVVDKHDQEYCERNADEWGNLVDAEESVEIVHVKSAEGHEGCGDELCEIFRLWRKF